MELTAFEDGVLLKILVGEGESAELGAPIALIGAEGEAVPEDGGGGGGGGASPDAAAAQAAPAEAQAEAEPSETPAEPAPSPDRPAGAAEEPAASAATGELKASPIARRIAAEAGLDLRPLAGKGSGPDGRIVKADVERALAEPAERRAAPEAAGPAAEAARPGAAAAAPAEEDEVVDATPMLRAVARRMAEAKATVPHF